MRICPRTHIHACMYTRRTKYAVQQVDINVHVLSIYYVCVYLYTYVFITLLIQHVVIIPTYYTTTTTTTDFMHIFVSCSTADRAKSIKTRATINESPTDKLIRELREENSRLLEMLKGMKTGVAGDLGQPQGVSEEGVSPCTHECCYKYYLCVHMYTRTTQSKVFSSSIL